MDEAFQRVVDTIDLWLPALTWLTARLAATRAGRGIERILKDRLSWLKKPEAGKAFRSAFESGLRRYEEAHGTEQAAQAVARVVAHVAEHDTSSMDRGDILYQILADTVDGDTLAGVVTRHAFALEGTKVSVDDVSCALETLIVDYLRPAFRAEPYFTERVGFAELIGLLKELRDATVAPPPDLESLRAQYCAKIVEKYELISMQGISPKVQNQTIGIRMEDVFIPLRVETAGGFVLDTAVLGRLTARLSLSLLTGRSPLMGMLGDELTRLREEFGGHLGEPSPAHESITDPASARSPLSAQVAALLRDIDMRTGLGGASDIEIRTLLGNVLSVEPRASLGIVELLGHPRAVVRGHPGTGKSTITRYVAWAAAAGRGDLIGEDAARRLPLRIRAIEFGDALEKGSVETLDDYLVEREGRFGPLVRHALAAGNALLLLDGLDEVGKADLRARVKERVDDFVADPAFADNHTLITTRIVGYERSGGTGRFPHFTLAELDDDQIADFVKNWYGAIHDEMPGAIDVEAERERLLKAVMRTESIHRMARNPLLLTIIALIKWQGRELPDQRVLLYDAAAQTLIRSWPMTQRRVELDELFIREWLAPAALVILEQQTSDLVDEYTLIETLVDSMRRLKSMTEIEARQATQELLEDVSLHTGILLPRGTDPDGRSLYGFLHQTFAEYMTAYYLAGKWEDDELRLVRYAHDSYWREVLLLMAGHLGTQRRAKAGKLIQAICDLHSSAYEHLIHRDLLLAGRVLGDGVPVGPSDLVESLLARLLRVWAETPITPLRHDIEEVLTALRHTEYAAVSARLARQLGLKPPALLILVGAIGAAHFVDFLADMLSHERLDVRYRAAQLLAEEGDSRGVEALLYLLGAEDESIRYWAARWLAGRDDPAAAEVLVQLLAAQDGWVCIQAAQALRDCQGANVHEALVVALGSDDAMTRCQAGRLLAERHDPRGLEALLHLLGSEDREVRSEVVWWLEGLQDSEVTEALLPLLDTGDEVVRCEAALLLAPSDEPRALDVLAELLGSQDRELRYSAASALAEHNSVQGLASLRETLGEEKPNVLGARLLAERGEPRAFDVLRDELSSDDPWVRYQAAEFLCGRGDPDAFDALVDALRSRNAPFPYQAMQLLAQRADAPCLDIAIDLLAAEDPRFRYDAAQFLVDLDDPRSVGPLVNLLQHEEADVRCASAAILAKSSSPHALRAFQEQGQTMLGDVDIAEGRSVADIGYAYITQHLNPNGELSLSASDSANREGAEG
jgi:HEAT repeat protein